MKSFQITKLQMIVVSKISSKMKSEGVDIQLAEKIVMLAEDSEKVVNLLSDWNKTKNSEVKNKIVEDLQSEVNKHKKQLKVIEGKTSFWERMAVKKIASIMESDGLDGRFIKRAVKLAETQKKILDSFRLWFLTREENAQKESDIIAGIQSEIGKHKKRIKTSEKKTK